MSKHIGRMKYGGVLKYALGAEISNQLVNATVREDKLPTEEELNQYLFNRDDRIY